MNAVPEPFVDIGAELAESPVWDEVEAVLWWVDLLRGMVHRSDPAAGTTTSFAIGQPVGALGLRRSGDLILAIRDGFATLDVGSGQIELIAPIEPDDPGIRMNDGKVGPDGGFWAGSMASDERPGLGRLHRLDPDGSVSMVLSDLTIPNGLDWTADGREMLFVDTPTGRIDRFDVDAGGATLRNRRPAVELASGAGSPDGMTLDAAGFIWVGLWDGWAVARYDPYGRLDRLIELPVAQVTSCAFGGPDLDELYITTAREGSPDAPLPGQPLAGAVFRYEPGVRGVATRRFPA